MAPDRPQESILGAGLLRGILATGALIAAVSLAAGLTAYHVRGPWQSMVFVVLGLSQLGVALAVRAPRRRGDRGNPGLLAAVALSGLLQVAGVLLPPLRDLLGTEWLTAPELLICAALATIPGLTLGLTRYLQRPKPRRPASADGRGWLSTSGGPTTRNPNRLVVPGAVVIARPAGRGPLRSVPRERRNAIRTSYSRELHDPVEGGHTC